MNDQALIRQRKHLYGNAGRFVECFRTERKFQPASEDFAKEFAAIVQTPGASAS